MPAPAPLANGQNGHMNGYSKKSPDIVSQLKNDLIDEIKSRIRSEIQTDLKASLGSQYQQDIVGDVVSEVKQGIREEVLAQLKQELQLHPNSQSQVSELPKSGPVVNSAAPALHEPPPSIFTPICHPLLDEAVRNVDGYYLQNWPFPDEKAKKKFVAAGFSRVTCLYFPEAQNDRIEMACSLLTILFLIDDQLEYMSLDDGKAYNDSLMPLCRGEVLPDRSVPVQWMMYDLWEDMRRCDKKLAIELEEPVFEFMRAQTAKERLHIRGLGNYLEYRQADVGQGLLAALMRFSMSLHLTPAELDRLTPLDKNTGRHIAIINDIYSYEKELHSSKTGHAEGGFLCSAVPIFAAESELSIPAAKNVLYSLAREWEIVHRQLVDEMERGGCNKTISSYMKGLEYHMSGNELWSRSTLRYNQV